MLRSMQGLARNARLNWMALVPVYVSGPWLMKQHGTVAQLERPWLSAVGPALCVTHSSAALLPI